MYFLSQISRQALKMRRNMSTETRTIELGFPEFIMVLGISFPIICAVASIAHDVSGINQSLRNIDTTLSNKNSTLSNTNSKI